MMPAGGNPNSNLGLGPSASQVNLSSNPVGVWLSPAALNDIRNPIINNVPKVAARRGGASFTPNPPPSVPQAKEEKKNAAGALAPVTAPLKASPGSAAALHRRLNSDGAEEPTLSHEFKMQDLLRNLSRAMDTTKESTAAPRGLHGRGPSRGPAPPDTFLRMKPHR